MTRARPEGDPATDDVASVLDEIESEPFLPDGRMNPLALYWLRHLQAVWDDMPGCDDPVNQRRYGALLRKVRASATP